MEYFNISVHFTSFRSHTVSETEGPAVSWLSSLSSSLNYYLIFFCFNIKTFTIRTGFISLYYILNTDISIKNDVLFYV